jgi:2-oxoglutarate dehydrogenase E1 component
MLLPHGYEGQGPEHSNAYVERFLSLCADENMQVIIPSTPAQYFHALRRQMQRRFRKPLISMMPKALLRDEQKASAIEEFTDNNFQLVIDDPTITPADHDRIRRVLLCAGKVYFTLRDARAAAKDQMCDCAIIRVEQPYPFPQKELADVLAKYGRKQEVCWVQEEPKNRGAWTFMEPRLRAMLPDTIVNYIGRHAAASPATGSQNKHKEEEREIVAKALILHPKSAAVESATAAGTAATAASPTPVSG